MAISTDPINEVLQLPNHIISRNSPAIFEFQIQLEEAETCVVTPVDLTGAVGSVKVKVRQDDSDADSVIDKPLEFPSPEEGIVRVPINAADTDITPGKYFCEAVVVPVNYPDACWRVSWVMEIKNNTAKVAG